MWSNLIGTFLLFCKNLFNSDLLDKWQGFRPVHGWDWMGRDVFDNSNHANN